MTRIGAIGGVAGAAFLLALPLAARAGPTPAPHRIAAPAPAGGERVEILVRRPAFLYGGTFQAVSASGAVHDQGTSRDRQSGAETPEAPMDRVLEGEQGTLTLRIEGGGHKAAPYPAMMFGRWTIVGGTGAYAGLRGGGTYTVTDGGTDERTEALELHTLVGFVRRP
jgi:hypothetical protein